MAYSALVRRLLISSPGDIPTKDLAIVQRAINRWNGVYGESFGATVVPISWGTHAAAEFGDHPQQLLNKQIVDQCDICLALFANRIGTPTNTAESGTAEEIERIANNGRYVAILRSRRPVDTSRIDLDQAKRLEEYLTKIGAKSLILSYSTDAELSERVDTILAAAIARDQGRVDLQLQQEHPGMIRRIAEVWPRVDSQERVLPFRSGSVTRDWYLVLSNNGEAPARDVRVEIESYDDDGRTWEIVTFNQEDEPQVEVLAPHGEIRFQIIITMGSALQVRCIVSWTDDRGRQENTATLRIA